MKLLVWLLLPAALVAGPARYARLGDFDGAVEVQLTPADAWIPAERNLPLPESAWIRTGPDARVEIELDDGNAWRLGPESQGGLADYTTLSTGQRVTLITMERGTAYFTGESKGRDSTTLVVPGAQLTVLRMAQVRLEASETYSQVYILQGAMRFVSPAAEVELTQRQTARVEPDKPSRFFLDREFPAIDLDRWNAARVKALAGPASALHVPERYGLADMDASGDWVQTEDLGTVWKPKVPEAWLPFQNGHWRWYGALGYTWIPADSWGWTPYHYGRWIRKNELGWVWAPAATDVFKPGEVYWMRAAKVAAWGPLAPGEDWQPGNLPRLYVDPYTTFAAFQTDAVTIDPAGFDGRPKEPLRTMTFTAALPSPQFLASRLDAVRPVVHGSAMTVTTAMPEVVTAAVVTPPRPRPAQPPAVIVVMPPAPPPDEVLIPVPVFEGVFLYTPPRDQFSQRRPQSLTAVSTPPAKATPPLTRPQPVQGQHGAKKKPHDHGESDIANQTFADFRDRKWQKAVEDLDAWSRKYPQSDYADDRLYYLAQAFNYLRQPERVLEYAAAVMAKGNDATLDERQTLDITYLAAMSAAGMPRLNRQQLALGRASAQSLLELASHYFKDENRPAETGEGDWRNLRKALEEAARGALKAMAQKG